MIEKFYTTKEAAEILRLTRVSIERMCRKGRIQAIKSGRNWLIPESTLEDLTRFQRTSTMEG